MFFENPVYYSVFQILVWGPFLIYAGFRTVPSWLFKLLGGTLIIFNLFSLGYNLNVGSQDNEAARPQPIPNRNESGFLKARGTC